MHIGSHLVAMAKNQPKLEAGDIAMLEYEGERGLFHCRGLLRRTSRAVLRHVMQFEPQGVEGSAWWVLTPTGDIYPKCVSLHKDVSVES